MIPVLIPENFHIPDAYPEKSSENPEKPGEETSEK